MCVKPGRAGAARYRHKAIAVLDPPLSVLLLLTRVGTYVGQQGHVACALERDAEGALVARTGAGLTTRLDLGPLGQVLAQARNVLVIYMFHFVHAEAADLAPRHVAVATARPCATRS